MYNESFWQKQKQTVSTYCADEKRKSLLFSVFRLLTMILIFVGLILGGAYQSVLGTYLFLCSLIVFVLLVFFHQKCKNKIDRYENQLHVIEKMKQRRGNEWRNFEETGQEFIAENNQVLQDLDILGKNSLYQRICVSKSYHARKKLAQCFNQIEENLTEVQKAIESIGQEEQFVFDFLTILETQKKTSETQEEKLLHLYDHCGNLQPLKIKWWVIFSIAIAFVLAALTLLHIINALFLAIWLAMQLLVSILLGMFYASKYAWIKELSSLNLSQIAIFEYIEKAQLKDEYLIAKQKLLCEPSASAAYKKLDNILSLLSLRSNILLYPILNALMMADAVIYMLLVNWCIMYAQYLNQWLETASDFETYLSRSLIGYALDKTCLPLIQKELEIEASDCAHPLIDQDKVVSNSFCLKGMNILTGSNMSGKSTFMRCVGVNTVLAMAGCRAAARTYRTACFLVLSSMRLNDELSSGISSFYAEILSIKAIMETIQEKNHYLVLIDEIFKGTNSQDRITGAKEAIYRLMKDNVLGIVTTHDFELCEISDKITNYHFTEYYENNQIHFDYQLHLGKCQSTNAIHLMRMAGIIE